MGWHQLGMGRFTPSRVLGQPSLLLIHNHRRRRLSWKKLNKKILFSSLLKKTSHISACMEASTVYKINVAINNNLWIVKQMSLRNHSKKVTGLVSGNGALLCGDDMFSTGSMSSTLASFTNLHFFLCWSECEWLSCYVSYSADLWTVNPHLQLRRAPACRALEKHERKWKDG